MTAMFDPPLVLALTASGQGNPNVLASLIPILLMLAIFYLLVLGPMRKRQKKVEQFRAGLKVGDRVITTGGIYGQVTKLGDQAVQLQIADKVKIDVARAAIGGYQGQEPVAPPDGGGGM